MDSTLVDDLLPALLWLDSLLERAVLAAQMAYGPAAAGDAFRGLHISLDEIERLLSREPASPLMHAAEQDTHNEDQVTPSYPPQLLWLQGAYGLSEFDLQVVLLALAPELDRRYERLYAYLQDHVGRRWPTVDLALNLLCADALSRLEHRNHFAADAPLARNNIVHLMPDPEQPHATLLAHALKLDEQIVCLILHENGLDSRLTTFCEVIAPKVSLADVPLAADAGRALAAIGKSGQDASLPVRLYLQGSPGAGQRLAAEAAAHGAGRPLLMADLPRMLADKADFGSLIRLLVREAWLKGAVLYVHGFDALQGAEHAVSRRQVLSALFDFAGVIILAGSDAWVPDARTPLGMTTVAMGVLDAEQRRACWRSSLAGHGMELDDDTVDTLVGRYHLNQNQIEDAVASAAQLAQWPPANRPKRKGVQSDLLTTLSASARAQTGHLLDGLAVKIEPRYTWADIVLPDDSLAQLHELCAWDMHRDRVLNDWGFERRLSHGKGVAALFSGGSGTGKTMAAQVIANELQLDLFRIDLSAVVSKYIGETEKNLERIFQAAEDANAILFFDEADALFGKRSEVRDSHDRYANVEISYLLQRMEQYEGLAILASNLAQNMDQAFVRRLAFIVHFPFPDGAHRLRIWQGIWPSSKLLARDVDLDFLARQFKLSGGNIKNIALAAAFLAAADGGSVTMAHLFHATQREYKKLGKVLSESELYGTHQETRPI